MAKQKLGTVRPSGRNRLLWIAVGVGCVVLLLVLAILIDSALYYNKIHSGISAAGVDLGGLTKDEAISSITEVVDAANNTPITLTAGDKTWSLARNEVEAAFDVSQAVSAALALTRENSFFTDIGTRWKLYFSEKDVPLTVEVDEARLSTFSADLAKEIDVAPVDASLAIEDGEIKVVDAAEGKVVDQGELAARLRAVLGTLQSATVDIPIIVKEPAVKAEDNAEAQKQAETMIGDSIVVTGAGKSWTISPQDIVSYMGFRSEERNGVSTLIPFIDQSKLEPLLEKISPDVAKKPEDASFDSDGTRAWVVPGQDGEELDAAATAQAITDASLRQGDRTVEVVVRKTEPDFTTAEAEARGIKDKLSSFTTIWAGGTKDREQNVRMATKYGSDVFLAPGEIYDTDKRFGPRTTARGYRLAPGITGPNTLEDVLGGGICQVSTTLFNAAFFAGLDVVERWNHSIYIDHYPDGRDATVTGGGKNLRFKNDTGRYIWIRGTSDGIKTTITIYGTDDGRKVSYTTSDFYNVKSRTTVTVLDPKLRTGKSTVIDKGQTGRSIKVVRTVTRADGSVLHKDTFTSTWLMYPITLAVGTATTSTTSASTTTTTGTSSTVPGP